MNIQSDVLNHLTNIALEISLRYAIQLMHPAFFLAESCERNEITIDDINEAKRLFMDYRLSAKESKD